MAAVTNQAGERGTLISTGNKASVITANETNQLSTGPGKVGQVIVWGTGTTWVVDIYDHASANSNPVWQWVSASGVGIFALQLPIQSGLRVVTSGTAAGKITIVWA